MKPVNTIAPRVVETLLDGGSSQAIRDTINSADTALRAAQSISTSPSRPSHQAFASDWLTAWATVAARAAPIPRSCAACSGVSPLMSTNAPITATTSSAAGIMNRKSR